MAYALRFTRCSHRNSIDYGVYAFGYSDRKSHLFSRLLPFKENLQIAYLTPPLSYIKKETALLMNGFGLLGFGVGYLQALVFYANGINAENLTYICVRYGEIRITHSGLWLCFTYYASFCYFASGELTR